MAEFAQMKVKKAVEDHRCAGTIANLNGEKRQEVNSHHRER